MAPMWAHMSSSSTSSSLLPLLSPRHTALVRAGELASGPPNQPRLLPLCHSPPASPPPSLAPPTPSPCALTAGLHGRSSTGTPPPSPSLTAGLPTPLTSSPPPLRERSLPTSPFNGGKNMPKLGARRAAHRSHKSQAAMATTGALDLESKAMVAYFDDDFELAAELKPRHSRALHRPGLGPHQARGG